MKSLRFIVGDIEEVNYHTMMGIRGREFDNFNDLVTALGGDVRIYTPDDFILVLNDGMEHTGSSYVSYVYVDMTEDKFDINSTSEDFKLKYE